MRRVSLAPPLDPPARLVAAVDRAREAALTDAALDLGPAAGATAVGEHLGAVAEPGGAVTHRFAAVQGGYRGWRWSVTLACADTELDPDGGSDAGAPVTVSEVVLVPGEDALVAPRWLPWQDRVRPGDLGVGDLLPADSDDPRLVPGYVASDDPAVEDVALEAGLGRRQVLSRLGREDAALRWHDGPHGPGSDMARRAPAGCGRCGFFLPVAGSLRAAFGVCGNEYSPADGTVVAVDFGCGAHSEVVSEPAAPIPALVYDDGVEPDPAGAASGASMPGSDPS